MQSFNFHSYRPRLARWDSGLICRSSHAQHFLRKSCSEKLFCKAIKLVAIIPQICSAQIVESQIHSCVQGFSNKIPLSLFSNVLENFVVFSIFVQKCLEYKMFCSVLLTHVWQIFSFYTLWKHLWFSGIFQGI